MAERLFRPLAGTHFAEGLNTMLDKIRSLVSTKALDYFAELDETIYVRRVGLTDYSTYAGTIHTLAEAARTERSIRLREALPHAVIEVRVDSAFFSDEIVLALVGCGASSSRPAFPASVSAS